MSNYDSAWKEAIRLHFKNFLELCFPDIAAQVDWNHPYESLDTELRKFSPQSHGRRRQADSLIRLRLLDGQELITLIHVEVQSQVDPAFLERLAQYHWRIRDHYATSRLCTLVVLGDLDSEWHPTCYQSSIMGCTLRLDFPTIKLLSLPSYPTLPQNPVSWLVAAHLLSQQTCRKPLQRRVAKWQLVRGLYSIGLSGDQIRQFYRLVDWVMALPEKMSYAFHTELEKFEEDRQVAHITSAEKIGIQKGLKRGLRRGRKQGLEQGLEQGLQEALQRVAKARWAADVAVEVAAITDRGHLERLLEAAATAESLETWLDQLRKG